MRDSKTAETTGLLRAWAKGDRAALDHLTPHVYRELKRIAGRLMQNERPGKTIQTTALVHEAYLKLIDIDNVDWQHRAQFFAVAAQDAKSAPQTARWRYDNSLGGVRRVGAFRGRIQNRYRNRYRAPTSTRGKLKGAKHMRMWRNWQTR